MKGEIVILVEGRKINNISLSEIDISSMLQVELQNKSLRDAVQVIAKKTNLPKRAIYQIALTVNVASNAG